MFASFSVLISLALFSTFSFAKTVEGQWHAGIGDPTLFGWVTVVIYMITMIFSLKKHHHLSGRTHVPKFWLYLAIFLLLLSINKQLDLQTWLTQIMRNHAFIYGWYDHRRLVQTVFIIFLSIMMLVGMVGLRVFLAKSWRLYKLAWVGVLLLCAFILMRAASFHHFDIFINLEFLGLSVNAVLEIGALIIILMAALKRDEQFDAVIEANVIEESIFKDYVEIDAESSSIQCPKCMFSPVSEAVHGKLFKCKQCGHKYTVFITA